MTLFIPGNVPSSKNNRVWTGKYFVESKACKRWRDSSAPYWKNLTSMFVLQLATKQLPVMIGFHFVRSTRHKYDWINPVQTVQDEMVKHGWISDDNITVMYPVPLKIDGAYSTYNKENPGVYIKLF